MLPHVGEYIVLKPDSVASLKHLDDPEVTKACKALESKSYVARVINLLSFPLPGVEYINIAVTLVSQGLPNSEPDRLILPDMSALILPNTSHPLSRSPMKPSPSLPWSDYYHPTQAMTRYRIRSDTNLGDSWPEPKYKLDVPDRLRLSQQYFNEDADRRDVLRKEQIPESASGTIEDDVTLDKPDECQVDTGSHSFCDIQSLQPTTEPENQHSGETCEAQQKQTFAPSSFFRSIFRKVLPCIPCLRADFEDDDDDNASMLSFDPVVALSIFSRPSTDLKPVILISNNLEFIERINDPWEFFHELEALRRIEEDYHERVIHKIQNDIERTRQKDRELHARFQSKMSKALPEETRLLCRKRYQVYLISVTSTFDLSVI